MTSGLELSPSRIKHAELMKFGSDIVALYLKQNMTLRAIGRVYGVYKAAIKRVLIKHGVKIIPANHRVICLICIACSCEFQARKELALRCVECRKKIGRQDAKERYRRKHAIDDKEITCQICSCTILDAPSNRQYCD